MTGLETNIFQITNLSALATRYRLYRVRGLHPEQAEYQLNRQLLIRKLSYFLRSPVTVIERDGDPYLVLRDDAPEPPSPYMIVRRSVYFDKTPGTLDLDYTARSPENDDICLRFLQFWLQAPLHSHPRLWQPSSGQPFFERSPFFCTNSFDLFRGFAIRVVTTSQAGLGFCVDVRWRFVSHRPLAVNLPRKEFRHWQNKHCIYHFGHRWYDIQLAHYSDLNASEMMLKWHDEDVTLLEYVHRESGKPIPPELANLPHDAAVIHYYTQQGQTPAAPAGLCYPVLDTSHPDVQKHQWRAALPPDKRRAAIMEFVTTYLRSLRFGDTVVNASAQPMQLPQRMFNVPDCLFGNGRILSVTGSPGAQHVSLDRLGVTRSSLLRDKGVGLFVTDPLDHQYLVLPQSVADSWGQQLISDLGAATDELFPQEHGYAPTIVTYNDHGPRHFVEQGQAILAAARARCTKPGYAVVMVHHTARGNRQHDQLAAMVIRELRSLDVHAAVMHSAKGQECYEASRRPDGQMTYRCRHDKRGALSGYLRMVALNKILLPSERWPFVLAKQLHADVTIGIDVKHNTAGFTIVGGNGRRIHTVCHKSSQKERLLPEQVRKYIIELVRKEARARSTPIRAIVIHRDGRLYQDEADGAEAALAQLKADGTVAPDAAITLLKISKSAPAPLRLFDISLDPRGGAVAVNPQVGCYYINGKDGYLCSTGRMFLQHGTVRPLHVRHVTGPLPLEQCLEDIYCQTVLAWTRPEGCTRDPITIKLTDRRLGEDATEYDADALAFDLSEESQEAVV